MEDHDDYWDHQRPGLRKAACAWAIVAVLALIFGITGLVWPSQPVQVGLTTADAGLALRARRAFDREHVEDTEQVSDADKVDETGPANLAQGKLAFER
jgi:anti-sigma-K factor RskA